MHNCQITDARRTRPVGRHVEDRRRSHGGAQMSASVSLSWFNSRVIVHSLVGSLVNPPMPNSFTTLRCCTVFRVERRSVLRQFLGFTDTLFRRHVLCIRTGDRRNVHVDHDCNFNCCNWVLALRSAWQSFLLCVVLQHNCHRNTVSNAGVASR